MLYVFTDMAQRLLYIGETCGAKQAMEIQLQYGEGTVGREISDSIDVTVLKSRELQPVASVELSLDETLSEIGKNKQDSLPKRKDKQTIAIAVPNESRSLPIDEILPNLLKWLYSQVSDLKAERVTIIIGCSLHAGNEEEVIVNPVPLNLPQSCQIYAHDAFNSTTVSLGGTTRGTPVLINEVFTTADYKIVVGQVDPSQFIDFTDGISGLITSCSGKTTLEHNHSLMFEPAARVGVIKNHPVREDLNESAFRNQELKMSVRKDFLFGRTLSKFDVVIHSEMDPGVL